MEHLPIFLDIKNKPCLVAGGGEIALRKVNSLLRSGAAVTVVSPRLGPELEKRNAAGELEHREREFRDEDLEGFHLAIAATDNRQVNRHISQLAKERRIPVNVVDQPELCSVIFPSIIRRSLVTIALSSGGQAPFLTKALRKELEAFLDDVEILRYESVIEEFRRFVINSETDVEIKRRLYSRLLSSADTDWDAWSKTEGTPPEWSYWLKEERGQGS